jgi:hypothetical protein
VANITKIVKHGDAAAQKDLLAGLAHDIQAAGRDDIRPVFKIPHTETATEPRPSARAKVRRVYPKFCVRAPVPRRAAGLRRPPIRRSF